MEADIFISYRRNIDGESAARLTGELRSIFGDSQVFLDVDHASIPPGTEFPQRLRDAVTNAKVVLAIISPRWLEELVSRNFDKEVGAWEEATNASFAPDWVRRELGLALELGKIVVPIRVQKAVLPSADQLPSDLQGLVFKNDIELPPTDPARKVALDGLQAELLKHVLRRITSLEAKSLIEDATSLGEKLEYEAAALKAEEAMKVAAKANDETTALKASLYAASCLIQHLWNLKSLPRSEARIGKVCDRIEDLILIAKRNQSPRVYIDHIRMMLAVQKGRDEEVVEIASRIEDEIDTLFANPFNFQIDAVNQSIEALLRLGRKSEALAYVEKSRSLESLVEDEGKFILAATRLPVTEEVVEFSNLCQQLAATDVVPRERMVPLIGRLASIFNNRGQLPETFQLLQLAYSVAEPLDDPLTLANVCMQIGEVASVLNEHSTCIEWLAKGDIWVESCRDSRVETIKEQWASLRCNSLVNRGRSLNRLAKGETDSEVKCERLLLAKSNFEEAIQFAVENQSLLRGDSGLFIAQTYMWIGMTCRELGMFIDAATAFRSARERPEVMAIPWAKSKIGAPCWHDEIVSLAESGRIKESRRSADSFRKSGYAQPEAIEHLSKFEKHLEDDIQPIFDWLNCPEAIRINALGRKSVREAVAEQISPLLQWWDEWRDTEKPWPAVELLDFWGRGAFSRIVAGVRGSPVNTVSVDAFCIDDIRQAARMLCPLFQTVIVKWKGHLNTGVLMCPVPDDLGGEPYHFGGHGYTRTADECKPNWHIGVGSGNLLPKEIVLFLAEEALKLFRRGSLLVVPAPLVGCTQTAVGWTDDLFLDNLIGGAVSIASRINAVPERTVRTREVELNSISFPFIAGVSMSDLADVLDQMEEWTNPLRKVLLPLIADSQLKREHWGQIAMLEHDIRDASRFLEDRIKGIAAMFEYRVETVGTGISAVGRRSIMPGHEPVTDVLRSIAPLPNDVAPWVIYWRLEGCKGQLDWTRPLDNANKPVQHPLFPDVLFDQKVRGWLVPGDMGCGMAAAWRVSDI